MHTLYTFSICVYTHRYNYWCGENIVYISLSYFNSTFCFWAGKFNGPDLHTSADKSQKWNDSSHCFTQRALSRHKSGSSTTKSQGGAIYNGHTVLQVRCTKEFPQLYFPTLMPTLDILRHVDLDQDRWKMVSHHYFKLHLCETKLLYQPFRCFSRWTDWIFGHLLVRYLSISY